MKQISNMVLQLLYLKKHQSGKETLAEVATSTSNSNINMKRQVKISSITGVGISDDGLT